MKQNEFDVIRRLRYSAAGKFKLPADLNTFSTVGVRLLSLINPDYVDEELDDAGLNKWMSEENMDMLDSDYGKRVVTNIINGLCDIRVINIPALDALNIDDGLKAILLMFRLSGNVKIDESDSVKILMGIAKDAYAAIASAGYDPLSSELIFIEYMLSAYVSEDEWFQKNFGSKG